MTPLEVLAAHRLGWAVGRTDGCVCGWTGTYADHPAHVLDALTKAGHVVVTPPEATSTEDEQSDDGTEEWRATTWLTSLAHVTSFEPPSPDGVFVTLRRFEGPVLPHHLREAADSMYAAAAAAETGGKA